MRAESFDQDSELFAQVDSFIVQKEATQQKPTQPWLTQLYKLLSSIFVDTNEPKLRQIIDRRGNVIWQIYDPTTSQIAWFGSETDVRIWFEQRFNS